MEIPQKEEGSSITLLENIPICVKPGVKIVDTGVLPGACVIGIAHLKDNLFLVEHIMPGFIVAELTGLAKQDQTHSCVCYQHGVSGLIESLYTQGNKYSLRKIKQLFSNRDRYYSR